MSKVKINAWARPVDNANLCGNFLMLPPELLQDTTFNSMKPEKKIINKSGEIIDDRFGMMNILERTLEPMFEEKIEKYIFIPNDRTNSLLREIIKDTEDSKDII